ncbi:MAG: hypothetical protein EAZ89_16445 [Bacteroidetes bacterium]|nr:MAG: hypothetical protein EAZ89_16445 [Bacteroidota bacterium]
MFQDLSAAILEALILMIGAAVLAGVIVWLLMRSRIQSLTEKLEQHSGDGLLASEHDALKSRFATSQKQFDELKAQFDALKADHEQHAKLLTDCSDTRGRLEAELQGLRSVPPAEVPEKGGSDLDRIRERAKELDFSVIGAATADEKDDLLIIKGIGPFIEQKLHSIGIFTFRQIANFTPELEDKVNDVIEFFPGRIRREKWVEQAVQLHEEKYGKKA